MSLARNFVRLGSANVVMLAAHVITIMGLATVAPANQFGLFLLALSISQPFATFAGLRLDSAFPSIKRRQDLRLLLMAGFMAVLLLAGLQAVIVIWLADRGLFEFDQLEPVSLALLPLLVIAQALVQTGRLWAVRFAEMARVSQATYVRAFGTLLIRGGVIVALLSMPDSGLGQRSGALLIAGEFAITCVMAASLFPFDKLRWPSRPKLRRLKELLRANWKYPWLETPSTMLDNIAMNAPMFLVTQFFGLGATASFGLAFRGLAVPVAQIARTLTEVMQVRYSELQRSGDFAAIALLFRKSSLLMAVGGIVAIVGLATGYGLFADALPAGQWRETAMAVLAISPWVVAGAVVNINSRLILMLRRQEYKLIYDLAGIAIIPTLVWLNQEFAPDFLTFVTITALCQTVAYALYWALINTALNQAIIANAVDPR